MENNGELRALIEEVKASNLAQEKYAKKQYFMAKVTAASSIIILVMLLFVGITLLPRINTAFHDLDIIMADLETVTSELADANIGEMVKNIDHLATTSDSAIQNATEKLNSVDIDSLNKAIKELSDVVEPFANFFNNFR